MMNTSCSCCGKSAEYSLNILLSRLDDPPRKRKSGDLVHFCNECLRVWIVHVGSIVPRALERSAWTAYMAIQDDENQIIEFPIRRTTRFRKHKGGL